MGLPPGPRTPGIYNTLSYSVRPRATNARWHRKYGDVFTVTFAGFGRGVAIADPHAIRELFTGDQSDLLAGDANGFLTPILGKHSLLTLDGPEHLRQRRLLSPPFQGSRVTGFRDVVRNAANREIDSWRPGSEIVLRDHMRHLTFEVICRAVFGVTERERIEPLRDALVALVDASKFLIGPAIVRKDLGRLSPGGRFQRTLRAADKLLYEEIERRRGEPDLEDRNDVLSLLMCARDDEGNAMSDVELRDELVTLLGAGHETTATSLAFGIELLLHHPGELSALRAAIAEDGGEKRLEAVMRETMRVKPVIDAVERTLTKPRRVGAWELPAGAMIFPSIMLVHKRPDLYEDPGAFRPQRYLDAEPESYGWLPFGGGIRRCIGAALAQAEFIEALRVIVMRTELEALAARPDPIVLRGVTLVPKHGVRVRVKSVQPFEQVLDDARGRAPDQVAVDGVGGGLERDPLAH
ncbi:MAG: cytochrome P450 [Gaiellaceae bacterium]